MPTSLFSRQLSIRSFLVPGMCFIAFSSLWFIWALRYSQTGWDFTEFYIAARLPISSLYSHDADLEFGQRVLSPIGIQYYPPFVRPAIFALVLKPLALFSYWKAYWLWAAICFVAYIAALLALFRRFSLPFTYLPWFAVFHPGMASIVTGQDADVLLLVLLATLFSLMAGWDVAAGLLLALCTYKFNLILFLPLVLLFKGRWKCVATFVAGAAAVGITSAILVPPSQYFALLHIIPEITIGFVPGGIRGIFIRAGHPAWYFPVAVIGALVCLYLMYKLPLVEGFCAAITAALLLSYHATLYDCALLVLPIAVAWSTAGNRTKLGLLTLLVLPVAWFLLGHYVQPMAELFLLGYFVQRARRDSGTSATVDMA